MQDNTPSKHLTWAENYAFTHLWGRRTRSHRYGGCPAAPGHQDGASCYRGPMTLLIPSWLSLRSAPHIPPINRTACQLILPSWLLSLLPSILQGGPKHTKLPTPRPYPHLTTPPPSRYMTLEALNPSFIQRRHQSCHLNTTTHQSPHSWSLSSIRSLFSLCSKTAWFSISFILHTKKQDLLPLST